MKYPEEAKAQNIQGRVMLQFVVGADGALRDIQVVRSAHELLDAEAVRVVSASPKWEPGYNAEGKAVPVSFMFPLVFKLQ